MRPRGGADRQTRLPPRGPSSRRAAGGARTLVNSKSSALRPTARHLSPSHRPALLEHFGALSRRDLYLRFGTFAGPDSIAAYIDGIDFDRATELGISVLASARRRGIGTLLMRRAPGHARRAGAGLLFMHCLAENDDLLRLARAAWRQALRLSA
jgi:GNAT superfamily N-acetyltransferase